MSSTILLRRPRIATFIVCVLFLIIYIIYVHQTTQDWNDTYIMKLVNAKLSLIVKKSERVVTQKDKNHGLILDTPGCKIMKLDPFDPSIIDLYEPKERYNCKEPPMFLYSQPGGSISVNETILYDQYHLKSTDLFCVYQGIYRKFEKPGNVRENDYGLTEFNILPFNVPLKEEYIFVLCDLGKTNFTHYFPLVHLKDDIEKEKSQITLPKPHLNVIVAGVDSISKLNFWRHFKKTQEFMKEKGNWFDMQGYVKVGDNTFPNLTPLLTGQHIETIWNDTLKDTMYFDDVDIIWKRYAKKGYRTFYAEDSPYFGTFNYGRRGFNNTPTDYYMRPLYLAMHKSALRKKGSYYCFNSVLEPDMIYNYLRDYVKTMGPRPHFAFAMTSAMTHDYLNYAAYADYPQADLLEDLWKMGSFNNTVIVIFGDHGLRFGSIRNTYVGKYEERMPFLFLHFPTWFLEKYPHIHKNLQTNTERLTTLFDVYATMVNLLDVTKTQNSQEASLISPYGLSLLEEISPYRTCEKAGIFIHWCTCQVFQYVSPQDQEIAKSSQAVKDFLSNHMAEHKEKCELVSIQEVKEAKLGQLNDLVLRFVKHEGIIVDRSVWYTTRKVRYEDFVVTLLTKPCDDTFEATVRHNVDDDSYEVVDIHNIDYDPNRHYCIDDPRRQPFCCCK